MKLVATVLAILVPLVALPLLAGAQSRLDPPYQLDPGESPPPTSPPPPAPTGSFPANDPNNWGYRHPECPAAATIEATSCGSSATAGSTVANCSIAGGFTFGGSNITMSCVKWDLNGDARGAFCNGECRGIEITRTTMTGSGPEVSDVFLNLSTTYGGTGFHTMRVEKSVIQKNRVSVILGGGKFDKDSAAIEPGFAFVARENIFRDPRWPPGDHSEHIAFSETLDGALIENNVFDCQNDHNSNNACNTSHFLSRPSKGSNIGNITIQGNRFIGDTASTNGAEFTFNDHVESPGNPVCTQPVQFLNNIIERFTTGSVFLYNGCPRIEDRPGSSCSGNSHNGSPMTGCPSIFP